MQNGRSLGIQIKIDCSHPVLASFVYFRSHPDPILSIFNTRSFSLVPDPRKNDLYIRFHKYASSGLKFCLVQNIRALRAVIYLTPKN